MVVQGKVERGGGRDRDGVNQYRQQGKPRSLKRTSRSSGGSPSPTHLHPHPLPSTTSRTGWAGQNFKHRDTGQAARGVKKRPAVSPEADR